MPFVKADIQAERQKIQKMIESDPEMKEYSDELDREYEFRQKLIMARKQSGLTQKELSMISGLDHRAISRAENNADISPNLKTLIKYIDALGFQLDITPK